MSTKAAQYIHSRAIELGITLWIIDGKVKYRGKAGTIPPKMFEIVKNTSVDVL